MSMKRIAILGSTGSVGQNSLELLDERREDFKLVFLSAWRSREKILAQAASFELKQVALAGESEGGGSDSGSCRVLAGPSGILQGLEETSPDLVLNAITGSAGLPASAWTIENGKTLLLANKESLVCAGSLLMSMAASSGARILPVDSEHAAIHQCLRGERRQDLRRIYLTASGGPFRDKTLAEMQAATPAQALAHPTWDMGPRITIGSATLMNKAFEVIEAQALFSLVPDQIEVLLHRQSIVHSMVEFCDASIIAQLGVPDMRVPILYCLAWPERSSFDFEAFDLKKFSTLSFESVDRKRFPALDLGYDCIREGGDSGAVLNAADEVATKAFLERKIPFPRIVEIVRRVLDAHEARRIESLAHVFEIDTWARRKAESCLHSD